MWLCVLLSVLLLLIRLSSAQVVKIGEEEVVRMDVGGIEYVSLPRVIRALKGELWMVGDKVVCLVPENSGQKELVFTLNSRAVVVCDEVCSLSHPVITYGVLDGSAANAYILIPVSSLKELFALSLETLRFRSGPPHKEVKGISISLRAATVSIRGDTTLYFLEVDTTAPFYIRTLSSLSKEVVIGARCDLKRIASQGIVREIKPLRGDNETRLKFYLRKPALANFSSSEDGFVVKFYPRAEEKVSRLLIVLDPGHGGKDPGAVGRRGTKEKDLNLAISRRLKKKLEGLRPRSRGVRYKVLLTREDDRFVPLRERTEFANRRKASLFLSIHCNASRSNPRAVGFETYFLSEARTDLERAQALKENEVLKLEGENPFLSDELAIILSDLAQAEFLRESEELACSIQSAADAYLGLQNRGVKQAGFYVLRGALMPAVLIECGFLSNPREERLLAREKTLERIAEAIFRGVKGFLAKYEERLLARKGE